jgi:hypothetical protein
MLSRVGRSSLMRNLVYIKGGVRQGAITQPHANFHTP